MRTPALTRRAGKAKDHAERAIAFTRIALAAASLLAVWLDPSDPAQFAHLTYVLQTVYFGYALIVAVYVWFRGEGTWLPIGTHATDVLASSIFQYITLGSSSPFFVYFIFALFCAAIRWGWKGTLRT